MWNAEQRAVVENRFRQGWGGYEPADAERIRLRVQAAMTAGKDIPYIERTPLRRRLRGASVYEVDGFVILMGVWRETRARVERDEETARRMKIARGIVWSDEQIALVRGKTFALVRGGAYAPFDVNAYLDSLLVRMHAGELLPDINNVLLGRARRGRKGYDAQEVDDFLETVHAMMPEG